MILLPAPRVLMILLSGISPGAIALQSALHGNFESLQPHIIGAQSLPQELDRNKHRLGFKSLMSSRFREANDEAIKGFAEGLEDGVSVIVPGLGEYDRVDLVQSNIQWLSQQGVDFDCIIYVYRDEQEFPLNTTDYAPCQLVRHSGFWMEHLLAFPLRRTKKKYIVHMLDSVRIGPEMRLQRMLNVMSANDLVHVAPSFSPDGYGCKEFMYHRDDTGVGRFTDLIELQMDVFTRENFACMQDIIDTDNKLGWGVAEVMSNVCQGNLGILDEMTSRKESRGSYDYTKAAQLRADYIAAYTDLIIPRGDCLGSLTDPKVGLYRNLDGLYCRNYGSHAQVRPALTEADAKFLCDRDDTCEGVAQWTCGSQNWTLCGYHDPFAVSFGAGRCAHQKLRSNATTWAANEDMAVEGDDILGACSGTLGFLATVENCKAACEITPDCRAFSIDKEWAWCGMKSGNALSNNAKFDTYVLS